MYLEMCLDDTESSQVQEDAESAPSNPKLSPRLCHCSNNLGATFNPETVFYHLKPGSVDKSAYCQAW